MNLKIAFVALLGSMVCSSCSKEKLAKLDFDVSTTLNSPQVNEEISFIFKGNADNITFFSGEEGHKYDNRNNTRSEGNSLQMDFSTWNDRDPSDFTLLVSTDFSGLADTNSVRKATWVDITDKAVFSKGVDRTPSGLIDLSAYSDTGRPVTIAFRYEGKSLNTLSSQWRWVVRAINFSKKDADGVVTKMADMSTTKWGAVSFENKDVNWVVTTAQLLMTGGKTELDDDWIVSQSFDVNTAKADVGEALKNIKTDLTSFKYKYTKKGVYKAVFVASNVSNKEVKEVRKELTITVQ